MSQPMKVKVKYVQEQTYIIIFGIYRRCQAAIPSSISWLVLEL